MPKVRALINCWPDGAFLAIGEEREISQEAYDTLIAAEGPPIALVVEKPPLVRSFTAVPPPAKQELPLEVGDTKGTQEQGGAGEDDPTA